MSERFLRVPPDRLRAQIEAVLTAWGMPAAPAAEAAEVMVRTDLMGVDSHGVSMLIMYDEMQAAGRLRLDAEPRVERETAVTALIDAGAGLGHPVSRLAADMAAEKAAAAGAAAVSVRNSHHHGALGWYARRMAERGLIGIVASTTSLATATPAEGVERLLGTNPFAFAAPAGKHPPLVLDMSTSVVAANKVKAYALKGDPLPPGWVVDEDGRPLTDSARAYELLFKGALGGLSPIGGAGTAAGGHKGTGLAIFAQILAGSLGGASFTPTRSRAPDAPHDIGHLFLALDPAAFREPEAFRADVDVVIDTLRASRPADPARPVLLPGDPERVAEAERGRLGVPAPPALMEKLRDIVDRAGAPWLL